MSLLNEDEVLALPDGTEVLVTWSGGNGPWAYTIRQTEWGPVAMTETEIEQDKEPDMVKLLTFVGSERYHTHVEVLRP